MADLPPEEVQACLDRGELDTLSEPGRELLIELAQPSVTATKRRTSSLSEKSACFWRVSVHVCWLSFQR